MQQLAAVSEEFHQEAIDFLRALLHPDPARRMTAERALQYTFLTTSFLRIATDGLPPSTESEIVYDTTFDPMLVDLFEKEFEKNGL